MSNFSFMEKNNPPKGKPVYGILSDYVVLDTETTGLSAREGSIIEIGIVKVENYEETDTFSSFINPGEPITPFITNLTGITDEMLADAPGIREVLPEILRFIGDKPVIAHNAGFDIGFMTATCQKVLGEPFRNDYLDTVRMSRKLFPEMPRHRLVDLVNRFGINTEVFHRALSDAADTQKCYVYMCDYMANSNIDPAFLNPRRPDTPKRKPKEPDKDTPVYGRNFVLSGKLSTMPVHAAASLIKRMGGRLAEEEKADYIVMSNMEYEMMSSFGSADKELRIAKDGPLILSETMFLEMTKKKRE